MQRWDYLTLLRRRLWERSPGGKIVGTKWEPPIEDLAKNGDDGWELVTIVPMVVPDTGSGIHEQALVASKGEAWTNEQLWVFKRPKT